MRKRKFSAGGLFQKDESPVLIVKDPIKELTLLLLFLNSWEVKGLKGRSAWKTFSYRVLDRLRQEDFINGAFHEKTVFLTDKGLVEAERLKDKYKVL